VIGAYQRLFQIEASFRMSKHDLAARAIYHHKRQSIEAHLSIVFAARAVGRLVEDRTGWSIRKFVRTTRRYRTFHIRAGNQILDALVLYPELASRALDVLGCIGSSEQRQPAQHTGEQQIGESKGHSGPRPRSGEATSVALAAAALQVVQNLSFATSRLMAAW
jgi:hypothetical protein